MSNKRQIPQRPTKGHSQSHGGVHPLDSFTHRTQRFEPLPAPLGEPPYHLDLTQSFPEIAKAARDAKKMVFHVVGDTGGIKDPEKQQWVAEQMVADLSLPTAKRPLFFYHLGDVVYFNGQPNEYYPQFYEPYAHYDAPIFSIPGNHDGAPIDDTQTSLDGWIEYFMTETPHVDPLSQDAPRLTQSQPNVYFTLITPFATIIGLYTNVPEHGSVDSIQQQWFTNEMATAEESKALIVALHHPIYSFDNFHSGSARMADVLQNAINDTRRVPNAVFTGHVHDYQRVEQKIGDFTIPFIVAGNGGYHNLHKIHSPNGTVAPDTQAKLVYGDGDTWGYLTLTIDSKTISGVACSIDKNEKKNLQADKFSYDATVLRLKPNDKVQL